MSNNSGPRARRIYWITEAGRQALHDALRGSDPTGLDDDFDDDDFDLGGDDDDFDLGE